MSASHGDALADLRLRLLANGYEPVPIIGAGTGEKGAGKRPRMPRWQSEEITPDLIRRWPREFPRDTNTGVRTGMLAGVDIDVPDAGLSRQVEDLAYAMLGPTALRRVGRAPKVLLVYRWEAEQPKAETPEFHLPSGAKVQVEVLGKGQQFVSHGTHPDTGQPYQWTALSPEAVPLAEVPIIRPARLQAYLAACESLFRQAGGRTDKDNAPPRPERAPRPEWAGTVAAPSAGEGFFKQVNTRALANLDAWVKALFPRAYWQPNATSPPGAYRVASADLGRGLEEDISIHAVEGCQDFGTREPQTPIDLVLKWGGAPDPPAAAKWLCDRLGVDPESLGWRGRKPQRVTVHIDMPEPDFAPWDAAPAHLDAEPEVVPITEIRAEHLRDDPPASPLPLIYFDDVRPNLDAADFVEGLLIDGAMSVIYGPSNCGKTFFAADLALHVAAGWEWRGREVERRGIIYCALEGAHGISNRVAAFKKHHGLEAGIPFAVIPVSLNLLDPEADPRRVVATIEAAAAHMGVPVGWIIMDTLSRAMAGGNENSPEDMGALVRSGDMIRQAVNAHLSWIHHSGKDQAQGARGHSLLRAATDTEIEISRDGKSPSLARVTKQRELEIDGEFAFKLTTVELGTNRRGKPVTSCVVEPLAEAEIPKAGPKLTALEQMTMRALREALARPGAGVMGDGRIIPEGVHALPVPLWRAEFYARSTLDNDKSKQKAFKRGSEGAIEAGAVAVADGRAWLVGV